MGQSMLLLSSSPTFTVRYDQFMFVCTALLPCLLTSSAYAIINAQYQVDLFKNLSEFCKQCRNIWGATRDLAHTMFRKYTRQHNKGVYVGFIKPSKCQMGGELISLLHLLRLKDALRSTINSKEFLDLNNFKEECCVLNNDNFWMYLFLMCRVLYAPMRVLRLADQQTASMDKLYFYVLQTDRILLKLLPDCKKKSTELLRDASLSHFMTGCDTDIDWGSNKEDVDDEDDDVGLQESDDDDSSLEIDDKEDSRDDDDNTLRDFNHPAQVSLCAFLNLLISFLLPKLP